MADKQHRTNVTTTELTDNPPEQGSAAWAERHARRSEEQAEHARQRDQQQDQQQDQPAEANEG